MAKRSNKFWITIGLILLLLVVGGIAAYKARTAPKGPAVTIEEVGKRSIQETVTASGRIFPEKEIIISPDVSGEIILLKVKEGDSVHAGQLLARIDPELYVSSVRQGEAGVKAALAQKAIANGQVQSNIAQKKQLEIQLRNAKINLDRNVKLHGDGVISQVELEQFQSIVDDLVASVDVVNTTIASSKEKY